MTTTNNFWGENQLFKIFKIFHENESPCCIRTLELRAGRPKLKPTAPQRCWYILWFYQDASGVCKTFRERWHTCSWFPRLICFFYLHKWYCLCFSLDIYDALNQHCCKLTGFQMCYILAKIKFVASLLSFDLNSELFIYIFAGHLAIYFIYETMLLLTHLSKILFTQM